MKLLIQFGNKGNTLKEKHLAPIAGAKNVEKIMLVCRQRGPDINKVVYYCTPSFLAKFAPLAVIYEFFTLLFLSIFKKPDYIGGYLLFPHITMAFITAKLARKPLLASLISGPYEIYTKGSFDRFSFDNPPPWHGKLFLKLLRHADVIITTGTFTKDFLVRQGINSDKVYAITNPPLEARFHHIELEKKYDLICVSRLIRIKHIEIALRAISIVKESYPNIKACIIGDGPLREDLAKLAVDLGIQNNVDFLGHQKDVNFYYNSSRIFVHTSEREGLPNVFMEACMCGLPSVVSNCGDITNVAQNGYNCFVISDYRDHEAFASAIISLLDDKLLYDKLSQNAVESIQKINRAAITATWETIFSKRST